MMALIQELLDEYEKELIRASLRVTKSVMRTAKYLGVTRPTMYARLKKHKLTPNGDDHKPRFSIAEDHNNALRKVRSDHLSNGGPSRAMRDLRKAD